MRRWLALTLKAPVADGRTHQEALTNAEAVIQEWLETAAALGRPIT